MSICYGGEGTLIIAKDRVEDFREKVIKKIDEEFNKYNVISYLYEDGSLNFRSYARWTLMSDLKKVLSECADMIKEGRIWFTCYDEDPIDENGFPFMNYVEFVDGVMTDQTLYRRLPYDWDNYNMNGEWFIHDVEKRNGDFNDIPERDSKGPHDEIDELFNI